VLGLDISTSVTGYSLINTELPQNDCVIEFDGIHLSKEKSLYDKAAAIRSVFISLSTRYKIDKVFVEEALQSFRRGLSSARTLSTLSRFNGIICYLAEDIFRTDIKLINVIHARSFLGLKINRKIEASVKDQVMTWVTLQPEFKKIIWPTKKMKSGPRKGQIVKDKSCYDIADASVMSLYGTKHISTSS